MTLDVDHLWLGDSIRFFLPPFDVSSSPRKNDMSSTLSAAMFVFATLFAIPLAVAFLIASARFSVGKLFIELLHFFSIRAFTRNKTVEHEIPDPPREPIDPRQGSEDLNTKTTPSIFSRPSSPHSASRDASPSSNTAPRRSNVRARSASPDGRSNRQSQSIRPTRPTSPPPITIIVRPTTPPSPQVLRQTTVRFDTSSRSPNNIRIENRRRSNSEGRHQTALSEALANRNRRREERERQERRLHRSAAPPPPPAPPSLPNGLVVAYPTSTFLSNVHRAVEEVHERARLQHRGFLPPPSPPPSEEARDVTREEVFVALQETRLRELQDPSPEYYSLRPSVPPPDYQMVLVQSLREEERERRIQMGRRARLRERLRREERDRQWEEQMQRDQADIRDLYESEEASSPENWMTDQRITSEPFSYDELGIPM